MKYGVVALVAVGVLVSGCQKKAEGQTVAVVNGEEITLPDLNFALESARIPQGTDKNVAKNQVLQQLVERRLLAEQARKEDIDKSPEYLNRVRRADEDLLISMLAARRLKTAQLPSDREVETFISSHPNMFAKREIWGLEQIQYTTPTDAATLNEIKNAKTMDQLAAVLQKHNVAIRRQRNRIDTATIPTDLYAKLTSLAPGEPFVVSSGSNSVASVVAAKQAQPIPPDRAKPVAVEAMRKTQTAKSLEDLLKSLQKTAKIEYQPGYAPPKNAGTPAPAGS